MDFPPKKKQMTCIFLLIKTLLPVWKMGQIEPYQIQHCFECIFKLFLKTVFNLFCEIGFK